MPYIVVKKKYHCIFCGVEEVEDIQLHWSIWDQLVHDAPETTSTSIEGERVWKLAKVCDACYERGKPYYHDDTAEACIAGILKKSN